MCRVIGNELKTLLYYRYSQYALFKGITMVHQVVEKAI